MTVTVKELKSELDEWYATLDKAYDNVFGELEDSLTYSRDTNVTLPSGRELKFIVQEGGEGEGDSYFYVFSIGEDDDEQLFRVDGYYASWDGVTYDDYSDTLTEVEAVIVPTVQYKRKK
jgi:hypothetical protein